MVVVEKPKISQVVGVVPRKDGEPGIEQVIAFLGELRVMRRKDFPALGHGMFQRRPVFGIERDGERKLAEGMALHFDFFQTSAQISDARHGGIIDQRVFGAILRAGGQIAHHRGLDIKEVPPLGLNQPAYFAGAFALPFAR